MKKQTPPQFYTVEEVAEALGISARTVRRRVAEGALHVHRIGRSLRISADDFRAFLALRRA